MRLNDIFAATVVALALASTAQAQNLVTNGDFEAGLSGFTSGYAYAPSQNTAEGQYAVLSNPYPWNDNFVSASNHTAGGSSMFVGNGSGGAGDLVWQSGPIAISALTDYFFEAFVMNVCCLPRYGGPNSAPVLGFSITLDGGAPILLNTLTIPLNPAGVWYGLSTSFNSGTATSAVLSLINANTASGGNDFAVDDIFLGTQSTVAGVPEPGAWALMLLGFGALGAALRRRRAQQPAMGLG